MSDFTERVDSHSQCAQMRSKKYKHNSKECKGQQGPRKLEATELVAFSYLVSFTSSGRVVLTFGDGEVVLLELEKKRSKMMGSFVYQS